MLFKFSSFTNGSNCGRHSFMSALNSSGEESSWARASPSRNNSTPQFEPFVDDVKEGYIPKYRTELETMQAKAGVVDQVSVLEALSDDEDEETRLAKVLMSKKTKRSSKRLIKKADKTKGDAMGLTPRKPTEDNLQDDVAIDAALAAV